MFLLLLPLGFDIKQQMHVLGVCDVYPYMLPYNRHTTISRGPAEFA